MSIIESKSKTALGFLTVINNPQHGLFGGYLVLSLSGHPLEFHCTAPIKPNRAQEILYGPTLESFLYGEQIGQTLVNHSKIQPTVICTDRPSALAVREYVALPVVLVLPQEQSLTIESDQRILRIDRPHNGGPNLLTFEIGRNRLALPVKADDERQIVEQRLGEFVESFDLAEPFDRIREAIEEARNAARS